MRAARVVVLLIFAAAIGCQPATKKSPFAEYSDREVAEAISTFAGYVKTWRDREASGAWAKAIADGSAAGMMGNDEAKEGPVESYPARRVAQFEKIIAELREELGRRRGK